ncbi:hypothetical protein [Mesobacillus sp.]|uniref:hypothetical protein n=1 Tax=Mesobacillus sp. TaxID=2675271 RepID=UPI0039EDFBEA
MNENDIKPHIDRLKKDPSLDEILNFTEVILKNSSKKKDEGKVADSFKAAENNQSSADSLNSLVTTVQSFINPTTLSLISKTLNPSDIKEQDSDTTSLKQKVEQLSAELSEVKVALNQTKTQLAEKSQRLEKLEASVEYLKSRRRRR